MSVTYRTTTTDSHWSGVTVVIPQVPRFMALRLAFACLPQNLIAAVSLTTGDLFAGMLLWHH